jgi:hypothetical protein
MSQRTSLIDACIRNDVSHLFCFDKNRRASLKCFCIILQWPCPPHSPTQHVNSSSPKANITTFKQSKIRFTPSLYNKNRTLKKRMHKQLSIAHESLRLMDKTWLHIGSINIWTLPIQVVNSMYKHYIFFLPCYESTEFMFLFYPLYGHNCIT